MSDNNQRSAAARIAELEAERDRLKAELIQSGHDFTSMEALCRMAQDAAERVGEERDRLKAEISKLEQASEP